MNKNKRLARLEQQYFPEANHLYFTVAEIDFMVAYDSKYGECDKAAPRFLRDVYEQLSERWRRNRAHFYANGGNRT